jgi:hypothetical protein
MVGVAPTEVGTPLSKAGEAFLPCIPRGVRSLLTHYLADVGVLSRRTLNPFALRQRLDRGPDFVVGNIKSSALKMKSDTEEIGGGFAVRALRLGKHSRL